VDLLLKIIGDYKLKTMDSQPAHGS